jgi:hypothetical protein
MTMTPELPEAMQGADYVVIDGIVFETEYLREPDEFTVADDVLLEVRCGDTELAFTQADLEGAERLEDGVYRLATGRTVHFLASATIH